MKRLIRFFLWSLLFLVLLAGVDQAVLRLPQGGPAWNTARGFYLDFRSRIFSLIPSEKAGTVEAIIERAGKREPGPPAASRAMPASAPKKGGGEDRKALRYVYVDEKGELQFADSLEEVPGRFRREAQALQER
jgi:hypothetical protein